MALLLLAIATVDASAQEKAKPRDEYEEKILPLLAKYCHKCHDAAKKKGELDLTSFKTGEQVAAETTRAAELFFRL